MASLCRRDFLKGTATVGAIGAAGIGIMGSSALADEATDPVPSVMTADTYQGKWSFEIAPDPITDYADVIEAELVVVGEGYSGLATATSAQQRGVQTVIVTGSHFPTYRGGSNHATYSRVMEEAGFSREDYDIEHIYQEQIISAASNRVDSTKWSRFCNNSEEAMNWMLDILAARGYWGVLEGCNTDEEDPRSPTTMFPASHSFMSEEIQMTGVGQVLAVDSLEDEFIQQGGQVYYAHVGKQLTRDGVPNGTSGRVDGVIAQNEEGDYILFKASKAVVLATGDFSRDKDMMAKYCPQALDWIDWDGAAYWDEEEGYDFGLHPNDNVGLFHGDGHKMGLWVGAAWQKTFPCATNVQGSWVCANQPYGSHRGLIVNNRGIRFNSEDCNGAACAMNQFMQPDYESCCIWGLNYAEDAAPWHSFGQPYGADPLDINDIIAGWDENVEAGTYFRCDSIEELADALNLPSDTLVETVNRYNELCEAGRDTDFYKKAEYMIPIKAPYYGAYNDKPVFYTVHGGLRTNTYMQVCDEDDNAIPGLYNVGTMVGDMFANIYTFRMQGHSYGSCLTFGYLTGKYIAENE